MHFVCYLLLKKADTYHAITGIISQKTVYILKADNLLAEDVLN